MSSRDEGGGGGRGGGIYSYSYNYLSCFRNKVNKVMEDIHQVFIKYRNYLLYRSSSKGKVPVNTRNTTPNTFSISFLVVPHLPLVSSG